MQFLFHGLAASRLSNLETRQILRWLIAADAHVAYERPGRTVLTPAQHVLHFRRPTLEHRFDRARVQVAHPARQVPTPRFVGGPIPKAYALDAAEDAYMRPRRFIAHDCETRQRPPVGVPAPPLSPHRCPRDRV